MNYNLQAGIPRVGGGFILDYSPPRQALDGAGRSFRRWVRWSRTGR